MCRIFREQPESSETTTDFTNMVIFCKMIATTPLRFRRPHKADFLGSKMRESHLLPKYEIDPSLFKTSGKQILKAGGVGVLGAYYNQNAIGHWKLMRTVIPASVWENWWYEYHGSYFNFPAHNRKEKQNKLREKRKYKNFNKKKKRGWRVALRGYRFCTFVDMDNQTFDNNDFGTVPLDNHFPRNYGFLVFLISSSWNFRASLKITILFCWDAVAFA